MKKLFYLAGIGFLAGLTLLAGTLALARENEGNKPKENKFGEGFQNRHEDDARGVDSTLEVHITKNGKALVRGARVTGVSGSDIMATTTWGSATINWTVHTASSTQFVYRGGSSGVSISDIKSGDIISFSGAVSPNAPAFTVNATVVKDWSVTKPKVEKMTLQGKLKSLAGTTAPTSFVLTVGGTDYTVSVGIGTAILKANWLPASLADFEINDTVRVYGSVDSSAHTVDATVVRNVDLH